MNNKFNFFKNSSCEYYPCHNNIEEINCLFCYCPLYFFEDCEGNYSINGNGHKNCIECVVPHIPEKGFDHVISKLKAKMGKKIK